MGKFKVVVVGASAGGVESLSRLVSYLPARLNAAVLLVLHLPTNGKSYLPEIIGRAASLPVTPAGDGDEIRPGHIYIALPNFHLLIADHTMRLWAGPKVNGVRPAVDELFRSAAHSLGPDVAGVVLSGTLGDGSNGLLEIKNSGGLALVQDPEEAVYPGMPLNAIERVNVDYVLPIEGIAAKLVDFSVGRLGAERPSGGPAMDQELDQVEKDRQKFRNHQGQDTPRTLLTCPECGGVLWEIESNGALRYRCQIGHAFSEESVVAENNGSTEAELWRAVRAMEERVSLATRLAARSAERGHKHSEQQFRRMAADAQKAAQIIQDLITKSAVTHNSIDL